MLISKQVCIFVRQIQIHPKLFSSKLQKNVSRPRAASSTYWVDLQLQGTEKSKFTAIKIIWRIERRKKNILAKQRQLEGLRQRCHEQLSVIIK
jgi:hypothetical protein